MEIIQRHSGVEISLSDAYQISPEEPVQKSARRGGRPVRRPRERSDDQFMINALLASDDSMELVDDLVLNPTGQPTGRSGRRGHKAAPVSARQDIAIQLELEEGTEGVLLLEQDGMYSWHFPGNWDAAPARRGARTRGSRRAVFGIEIYAEHTTRRKGNRRGFAKELIYSTVRAYVLKFVAKKASDGVVRFVERKLKTGLVSMPANDPHSWKPLEASSFQLNRSKGGQNKNRLLLMLHGTFSSTYTCFGALGATSWGKSFMNASREQYDAVLGYDHATLSESPDKNADDLYQKLRQLVDGNELQMDVVTHSRGGLVFRSLVEEVLPGLMWKPEIGNVVFVGVPNAGTTLAEPENWHAFVDLYTNLALAMSKALSAWPQATLAVKVMEEAVEIIGGLVKYMATEAVNRRRIPGLSAMQPAGSFIKRLNSVQAGQPAPDAAHYYAITSTFDVELLKGLSESDEPVIKQLPRHLIMVAVDNIANRLLGKACDLVVNTDSMKQIDPGHGSFIKESFDFGINPHVYHTVYFTRPEVTNMLSKWLGLPVQAAPQATARRGAKRNQQGVPSLEELVLYDKPLA